MEQPIKSGAFNKRNMLIGVLFALGAISIWAGWMAVTRLGVTTSLSTFDITLLRFGVAGILLYPIVMKKGFGLKELGVFKLVVLVSGSGAPYTLVASSGLLYAPASQAGVLIPGVMPMFVALLAFIIFKEHFNRQRKIGYGLILSGLLITVGLNAFVANTTYLAGQLLMLSASFMWATYTIVLRQSQLDALHAVAIVSVWSFICFLPLYIAVNGAAPMNAPIEDILIQGIFQGVVATVLALYFFGKAVSILGASLGSSFGALVPAFAALFAIPILSEYPSAVDWLGIIIVTAGVYIASGSSLAWFSKRR